MGTGSFGKVKLCSSGEASFAIKIFNKGTLRRKKEFVRSSKGGMGFKTALDDVLIELETMKLVNHPNWLKLYEIIDDDEEDKLYMILEYCEGGQILDWDPDTCEFSIPNHPPSYDLPED